MLVNTLVLLSALWSYASAEIAGALHERSDISPRQQQCIISGWIPVCPGGLPCIPPSGTCCSGGYYHLPGGSCPRGSSEVPRIGQSAPPPASITPAPTPAPAPAPPVINYTWYTYTITYYYFYYYYYYFAATFQLTSTRTTYFTTISLTASNQVAANSAFASVSAAISFATPTQAGTPTLGSVPPPTSTPAAVSSSSVKATSSSKAASSSKATTSSGTNGTLPSASPPPQFTGAASRLRDGAISGSKGAFVMVIGALVVAPGILMLLL